MSVLVYKDGVFAADTAGFQGTFRTQLDMKKIIRAPSGALIGAAGQLRYVQQFLAWDEGRGDGPAPEPTDDENRLGGIVVRPDGTIHEYDNDMTVVDATFAGWAHEGDGFEFCLALHTLGWSAEEIVAHAIKYCVWAGGEVYSLRLGEVPEDSAEIHPEVIEDVEEAPQGLSFAVRPDPAIKRFLEERGLE
jgi:hypothetical protein